MACGECWRQRRWERGRVAGDLTGSTPAACSTYLAGTPQRHDLFVAEVCRPLRTIGGGILDLCIMSLDNALSQLVIRSRAQSLYVMNEYILIKI